MNRRFPSIFISILLFSSATFASEAWELSLTPYVWLPGLKGDLASIPPATIPVNISSLTAVENVKSLLMTMFEAKNGAHGFFVDLTYTDVQLEKELIPVTGLTAEARLKLLTPTLAYQYAILNEESATVDVLAGVRGWSVDASIQFSGGLAGKRIGHDEVWIDPMIGAKARIPIVSSFYTSGTLFVGGFGLGSDFFYETSLNLGYQWTETVGTYIGYRILGVDYDRDGYIYHVIQQGAQLGLNWNF